MQTGSRLFTYETREFSLLYETSPIYEPVPIAILFFLFLSHDRVEGKSLFVFHKR